MAHSKCRPSGRTDYRRLEVRKDLTKRVGWAELEGKMESNSGKGNAGRVLVVWRRPSRPEVESPSGWQLMAVRWLQSLGTDCGRASVRLSTFLTSFLKYLCKLKSLAIGKVRTLACGDGDITAMAQREDQPLKGRSPAPSPVRGSRDASTSLGIRIACGARLKCPRPTHRHSASLSLGWGPRIFMFVAGHLILQFEKHRIESQLPSWLPVACGHVNRCWIRA